MARATIALLLMVAMAGCGGPSGAPARPADATLDLYNATARIEFDQGRPVEAASSYAQSLDRARQMDDPTAVTLAAYNLAIARAATGDYPAALAAVEEAGHEVRRTNLDPTDILLIRARVELLNGDVGAATAAADQVLQEPRSKPTPARQAQAHVIKGLAACKANDAGSAATELAAARTLASGGDTAAVTAMIAGLGGEVAMLSKDYPAAAAAFDRQAELGRAVPDYRTVCRALGKAGRAYGAAGRSDVAADRLYRAARAAVAGDDRDAPSLTAAAVVAAHAANDASLIRLTERLATRLGQTTRPTTSP